jgi:hypothetical protein
MVPPFVGGLIGETRVQNNLKVHFNFGKNSADAFGAALSKKGCQMPSMI